MTHKLLRVVIVGLVLAGLALAYTFLKPWLAQDQLEALLTRLGPWAPVVYIGIYTVAPVFFLPGSALTLVGGALFGPLWGTAYTIVGATMGGTLSFLLARYLIRSWAERKASRLLQPINQGLRESGWMYLAITRLIPLFPFNLLNYAYGLTILPLWQYVVVSFITMLPGTFVYVYLGYATRVAVTGAGDLKTIFLIVSSALGGVIVLSLVGKRYLARRGSAGQAKDSLSNP